MNKVKVRFAPSPTGFPNIGGCRTALFNFLFAKSQGGAFCLRIEDTDAIRSNKSYTQNILDSLRWLKIKWDGGIIYQSERQHLYSTAAHKLLHNQCAYKSSRNASIEFDKYTPLEKKQVLRSADLSEANDVPYAIRFKAPLTGKFEFTDHNMGNIDYDADEIDDFVLVRDDGLATYMLASVIDDYEMGITHIIRGVEHIPNTKRQIQLIKALDYPIPEYIHIPLINDESGAKLSKRIGSKSIASYQKEGILSEALLNYMCLLGWGHSDSREIISLDEAINRFNVNDLRKSPSRFDEKKLLSINRHYIRSISNQELMDLIKLQDSSVSDKIYKCLDSIKDRVDTLADIINISSSIFCDDMPKIHDSFPSLSLYERKCIQDLDFNSIDFSSIDTVKSCITQKITDSETLQNQNSKKNIFMYLRIALTGMEVSPGLFDIIYALGPDTCNRRLKYTFSSTFNDFQ